MYAKMKALRIYSRADMPAVAWASRALLGRAGTVAARQNCYVPSLRRLP
jgi:hypothetical protein